MRMRTSGAGQGPARVPASGARALGATRPVLAAPSLVSLLQGPVQGPVQGEVAPAHWSGQLVGIHSKTEHWAFAASSELVAPV